MVGGAALVALALLSPVAAQEAQVEDLRKEIESLREMLEEIRKDVREIKGSLARRGVRPSPVGTVIDFGQNPTKGDPAAKLTLVEFSDYQ